MKYRKGTNCSSSILSENQRTEIEQDRKDKNISYFHDAVDSLEKGTMFSYQVSFHL